VRHTVRPFIKEFKTRSAKSSAAHPQLISDADDDGSKPSFLDLNVFSTRPNNSDAELKVALEAADAVFGELSPGAPFPETSPLSNAPEGRVLRSQIGEDEPLTVRLTEGDGKSHRGRSGGKPKSSLPIRRKQPTLNPESEEAMVFPKRPAVGFSPDILIVSTPHRARRSIQKRWVLKTELKAGEKWKRRMCKAAR
jgi:hypothetical protein